MSLKKLLMLAACAASTAAVAAPPSYVASFAAPAGAAKLVSSDRLWSCDGSTCLAGGAATSPAKHICVRLAKEVGAVTAFSARGNAFSPEELAACNERAGHVLVPAAAK